MPPVETSDTAGGSWAQLVSPRYRRLVAISSLLFVFQQFAGINAVVFFSTKASATRHWEHAARGTHSEGHTHSPCSAPAAHLQRTLHTQHSRVSLATNASHRLQVFANAGVGSAVVASILVAACNIGGTACAGQLLDRHAHHPYHSSPPSPLLPRSPLLPLLPLSPVLRPLPLLPLVSPLPLLSFLTLASTRAAYLPLVINTTVVLPLVLLLPHLLYHSCHAYRPLLWPPRRHSCPDP